MSHPSDRIANTLAALVAELTTAAHAVGDAPTMLAALGAADRHYSAVRRLIYDGHDATLGLTPAPAPLTLPTPAERLAA